MSESKETICLDFDGPIHWYREGWKDGTIYDELTPGTKSALEHLMKTYNIVILTAREDTTSAAAYITERTGLILPVTNRKPIAIHYVDDRGIRFHSWDEALRIVATYDIVRSRGSNRLPWV